jgi:hypothetical protein
MPRSVHQRWRERPRNRVRHLTPGRLDGVVHAIAGRGPCPCLRAQIVQDDRAAPVANWSSRSSGRVTPRRFKENAFARGLAVRLAQATSCCIRA